MPPSKLPALFNARALSKQARKDVEGAIATLSPGAQGMAAIVAEGEGADLRAKLVVLTRIGEDWKVSGAFSVGKHQKPKYDGAVVWEWE